MTTNSQSLECADPRCRAGLVAHGVADVGRLADDSGWPTIPDRAVRATCSEADRPHLERAVRAQVGGPHPPVGHARVLRTERALWLLGVDLATLSALAGPFVELCAAKGWALAEADVPGAGRRVCSVSHLPSAVDHAERLAAAKETDR